MDNNRRILESMDEFKESKEFWLNKLSGELNEVILTADFFKTGDYAAGVYERDLTKELTDGLNRISKNNGLALYVVLLSALKVLLNKYTGQEDIIIASPAYIQSDIDSSYIENQLILFRSKLSDDMTFRELLRSEKVNVMETYKNQYYSLEKVFNELKLNYKEYSSNCIVLTLDSIHNKECISNSRQIVFSVLSGEPCYKIHISYNAKLFNNNTIERLAKNYLNILDQGIGETDKKVTDIEAMTEEERNLLLKFNDTDADYPRDKTIHVLFEEQAAKTPNNTAVVFEGKVLTYKQLNEKANKLARSLRENGVKPNSLIGIMVERSFEMVIGIIGILKAGGAYLPIDPDYPEERIRYILEDSGTKILLTQDRFIDKLSFNGTVLSLEDEKTYDLNGDNLENISTPRDLAYVIYTSGSTGKPKGAMIENYSLVNRLNWMQKQYPLKGEDVILQKTTYTFDVSVWELIWWSLVGAKVCMLEQGKEKDPKAIADIIEKEKITTIHFVPSMLSIFMEYIIGEKQYHKIKTLRRVFASGEAIGVQQVKSFVENISSINETQLINLYGPTEATVDVTYYNCAEAEENKSIPIGKPIDNIRLYIVDKQNNLQPIGVPGELCISGDGLARGYLNRTELTQEKFVICPFDKDERMYKTGDLARWLPDGNVEFLGRLDHQVKIRGFRIELGEIESLILSFDGVKEAIVIDKQDKDENKYLCAYMVSEGELSAVELRTYLSSKLPYYMVPSYFVQLHKMPLTSNGKLDRKKLPEPSGNAIITTDYEAPRDAIEEKLADIWREVLGIEKVGINDNFIELGGHSLKATIISSKIHKELNVEIPLGEIFNSPTIKEISNYINRVEKNMYKSIEKAEKKEYYEASLVQNRMYMLQQLDLKSVGYNMPVCMEIEGYLDVAALNKSMKELIRRHESFRTSFSIKEDKIIQIINDKVDFNVEYLEKEDINIEQFIRNYIKPFDLSAAPLLRMCVIKIEKNKHILLYDMHHIISDGVSLSIMGDEILRLYRGEVLEEPELQYKDYSEWQKKLINSGKLKKQEEYWLSQFSGEIPILNISTDYERPAIKSFSGDELGIRLNKELVKLLKTLAKNTESTMYIVLMSALNILLSKYSGQEDIVIGSPISGRTHVDFEKVIGMFINTIAVRNYPVKDKTYEEFLMEVKENSFKAFENQDYEFKELLDKLTIPIDISRNPLFDVMFVMQNMESGVLDLNGLKIKPYPTKQNIAKLDLTFTAKEYDEDMILVVQYCTELFKRETIERMMQHLINILKHITVNSQIKLSEIDMLLMEERNKLLYEFNNTGLDYPKNNAIHKLFEEQARRTPGNIALVYNEEKLTYKELDVKSNKLAKNLREKGVTRDSIVALIMEPSLEMIVGIMGIIKAGGAYLPISHEYPVDRIKYILEDSKAAIILTQSKFLELVPFNGEILDLCDEKAYVGEGEELSYINSLTDLVYVIYTSGTTGKPKGVMIEHKNLLAYVNAFLREYKLREEDNVLQQATYSFDAFIEEVYPALTVGGKVFIVDKYDALNLKNIEEFIYKNKINLISCSPLFLNELNKCDRLESIHTFISGGDVLKKEYFNNLVKKAKVYNTCGPTETTVCFSYYCCPKDISGNIPIGKPIANYQIYILDKDNNPAPIGVAGEIYVSGDGLARGYLNSPELTAERFVPNPFRSGEKMYKTGDLGRWLADGNIEFLGRVDQQVKIRGFRIEIGEIENQFLQYEDIREAIVIDREDNNEGKYLCAYLVSDKELKRTDLRQYLTKVLPEYMIPSYFVQLDKMPLTKNGKIDRKALPAPDKGMAVGKEYEPPRNRIEEVLVGIWQEVLGVERIGIKDNFFELGGHSLKATVVAGKIYNEFKINIPLSEIFKSPCIATIAQYITNADRELFKENIDGVILLKRGHKNVKNFFFIHSLSGNPEAYSRLSDFISDDFNCWGVGVDKLEGCGPRETSIEDMAKSYIEKIKKIQPEGSYYISGWCIGGIISYEVAKQFENIGDKVEFLGLYNSPIIKKSFLDKYFIKIKKGFTIKSEWRLFEKILPTIKCKDNLKNVQDIHELWEKVIKELENSEDYNELKEKLYDNICTMIPVMKKIIKNSKDSSIKDMMHYLNLFRTFVYSAGSIYNPKEKIKTKINYFIATKEEKIGKESWQEFSYEGAEFYAVDADHFSMFENEQDIVKLAKEINTCLEIK